MFDLRGKVALVTGGASGIGLAYVIELLENDVKGVAIIDIDVVKGQKVLDDIAKSYGGNRAVFVKADVTDVPQLQEAFETTVKTFKQLDIVINNAGIVQEIQWAKCVSVNLTAAITGSMLAMEKYFPKYKSGPEAVILNTASIFGLKATEVIPTYTATKFGLIGFTKGMGGDLHYEKNNVRVLAICPGFTFTGLEVVTQKQLQEPYLSGLLHIVQNATFQTKEVLAKHAVDLIRKAPNGSVWLADGGNCTEIEIPKY